MGSKNDISYPQSTRLIFGRRDRDRDSCPFSPLLEICLSFLPIFSWARTRYSLLYVENNLDFTRKKGQSIFLKCAHFFLLNIILLTFLLKFVCRVFFSFVWTLNNMELQNETRPPCSMLHINLLLLNEPTNNLEEVTFRMGNMRTLEVFFCWDKLHEGIVPLMYTFNYKTNNFLYCKEKGYLNPSGATTH